MWNQRYAEEGFAYGAEANDFLKESTDKLLPGGKILCLAEGEGRNAVYLAEKGFTVSCVDLSSVGLKNRGTRTKSIIIDTDHSR